MRVYLSTQVTYRLRHRSSLVNSHQYISYVILLYIISSHHVTLSHIISFYLIPSHSIISSHLPLSCYHITGVFRYLPSPHIQHIYPTVASVTGGALVRVYGAHFQTTLANYTCVFNIPTTMATTSATTTSSTSTSTATTATTTTTMVTVSVPAVCHSSALITCRAPPAPSQRLSSPGAGSIQLVEQYLGEILPLAAGGATVTSSTTGTGTGTATSTAVSTVPSTSFQYKANPVIDTVVLQVDPYSSLPYLIVTLGGTNSTAPTSTSTTSATPTSTSTTPTSTSVTPASWLCDVDGTRSSALVVAGDTVVCSVSDVLFDGSYKTVAIMGK